MIVGGYQISNALVAILLVASTTGAGVATDSFSGLDDFTTPLSDPSENITDVNETDTDDSQDSSGEGTQDSSSDGSSDSDSGDSGGSDQDSPDSSDDNNQQDSESEDSSDEEGGFLDNILGNEEENSTEENSTDDSVDQVDDTENVTVDNTTGTGTEGTENDTDSTQNDTTTAEITSFSAPRDSQFYDPYESTSVPLEAELTGNNVEYEVVLNGETNTAGSFSGTETINTSLTLSDTGSHEITLEITQSGSTVNSITRTFEIADSAIQQTGFSKTTTIRTGSEAGFRLLDNGEPVEDASISLDGTQTANTNADGEFTVQVPYQDTIKLSTGYSGIPGQEFNVTQDIPEPETTLIGPNDLDSFDTPTGTNRDVTFEASVEITEDSGTASLVIDGSEAYTQDLTSGTNSISTTQALSGGTHNWQVEVDTPEHKVSSSSRSLTVNEVEVQNGLSLQNNATAGEFNYVRLYDSGEPVEGTEITVNSDSSYTTDSNGEVGFEVPNAQEITVSASGYSSITESVEGYEEVNTPLVYSANIQNPSSGEVQKPFTFEANVDAGLADSYEIKNSTHVLASGSIQENSTNTVSESISPPNGEQTLEFVVKNSENGNFTSRSVAVDVWEMIQITSPSEGESFSSNEINFAFSLDSTQSGSYRIFVDGSRKYERSLNSSKTGYSQDLFISNSGNHQATFEVDSGGETFSETAQFNVENDVQTGVDAIQPTQGSVVQEPRFVYNVTYPAQYWTALQINGVNEVENEYYSSRQISTTYESLSYGDNDWQPIVKDEKSSESSISSGRLEFTHVEIIRNSPTGGTGVYFSPINFEFEIQTGSNTEATLYVDGTQEANWRLNSGSNTVSESVSLSSGEHNFALEVTDTESGKSTSSDGVFEVS